MGSKRWDAADAVALLNARQGKRLNTLRTQIRRQLCEHPDEELRLAFAAHYRDRGVKSQAARWGVAVAGWSTPEEIHELRHWILGRFSGSDDVRQVLELPADRPLPPEVADLVDPALRSRGWDYPVGSGGGGSLLAMGLFALVAVVALMYAVGWWVPRLWEPFDTPGAQSQAVTALVILAVSAIGFAVAYLISRHGDRVDRAALAAADAFEPELSRFFPTDLAWSLADAGDERGATILLKSCLRGGSERAQARQALVQLSRDRGRSDMSGRWGIAMSGLTTPEEQKAFAGAVRASGGTESALRKLSLLWDDPGLTADAQRVLALARTPSRYG